MLPASGCQCTIVICCYGLLFTPAYNHLLVGPSISTADARILFPVKVIYHTHISYSLSVPLLVCLSVPLSVYLCLCRTASGAVNQNEFGKYGVIRDESFFSKQRCVAMFVIPTVIVGMTSYYPLSYCIILHIDDE